MFPIVRSHPAYQAFVHEHLRRHYAPGALQFVAPDWALVAKFWRTDLSDTAPMLHETFSLRGPRPWDPADLLRSYLLKLEVGEPSIT